MKNKEQVRLRSRALRNGNKSLYLDYYHDGVREYEYLKLYLVPEKTPFDREQNKSTMIIANSVKAKRIIEINEGKHGISRTSEMSHNSYIDSIREENADKWSAATSSLWRIMSERFREFRPKGVRMSEIDERLCRDFLRFLNSKNSNNTASQYYNKFSSSVLRAYKDGLIQRNFCSCVEKNRIQQKERVYLTVDEVRAFNSVRTEGAEDAVKRAFVFGCLTGLRYSDIKALTWSQISEFDGMTRITFKQKKTGGLEYMDINQEAVTLMGEPSSGNVFPLMRNSHANTFVRKIASKAGIRKSPSFHSSRHTFAVTLLSSGVDIYTTSKLLGHRNLTTTQIYAKIVDDRKRDAVRMIPSML